MLADNCVDTFLSIGAIDLENSQLSAEAIQQILVKADTGDVNGSPFYGADMGIRPIGFVAVRAGYSANGNYFVLLTRQYYRLPHLHFVGKPPQLPGGLGASGVLAQDIPAGEFGYTFRQVEINAGNVIVDGKVLAFPVSAGPDYPNGHIDTLLPF